MFRRNKTKLNVPKKGKKALSTVTSVLALSIAITTSPPPLKVQVSDKVSVKDSCQVSVISANKSVVNKFAILHDNPPQTRSAGLGQSVNNIWGNVHWLNPTNIYTSNNVYSDASLNDGDVTHYLRCTDFGFTIPDGATIDGIVVEFERKSSDGLVYDDHVYIVKTGTEQGTNKALAEWSATESYASYGGVADKWGLAWTADIINGADFGVSINALYSEFEEMADAFVDHVRITVYYTEGAPSPLSINKTESIAVSESKSISIPYSSLSISKAESIAVTEAKTVQVSAPIIPSISKVESVAVTEAVSLEVPISALSIDKIESVAVTEAVSLQVTPAYREISKAESITISEDRSLQIVDAFRAINVSDSIAVSEDKDLLIQSPLFVKIGGVWKPCKVYVKIGGVWKPCSVWAKHDGAWDKI